MSSMDRLTQTMSITVAAAAPSNTIADRYGPAICSWSALVRAPSPHRFGSAAARPARIDSSSAWACGIVTPGASRPIMDSELPV